MGNTLYKDYDIQSPPIATGGQGYIWRIHSATRKSDKVPVSVWLFDKKAATSTEKTPTVNIDPNKNPNHKVPPLPMCNGPSPNPLSPLHKHAISPIVTRLKRGAQWIRILNQNGPHENLLKIIVPFEDTKQFCYMVTEPVISSLGNILGRGGVDFHWKQQVNPQSEPEITPGTFITDKYPTSLTHGGEFLPDEKLKVMKDVASLMSHLHKTIRIVHGNISPENIFFTPQGQVRVGGFVFAQPHNVTDLSSSSAPVVTDSVIPQPVTPTKKATKASHPAVIQSSKSNSHQVDLPILFETSPALPLYSIHITSPEMNPLKGIKSKSIGPAVSSTIQRVLLQPNLAYLPPELVTRGNLSTITPGGHSLNANEIKNLIKPGSNFVLPAQKNPSSGDLSWIPAPSADIYSFARVSQDLWLWTRDDVINYDTSKYHNFNPIQILDSNTCPKPDSNNPIVSSNKKIPATVSSILRYLLAPTRLLRPSTSKSKLKGSGSANNRQPQNVVRPSDISPIFQAPIFSKNKVLKAVDFADHINSKSPQDTAAYFHKFPQLLETIPLRFLIHRILPPLRFTLSRYTNTIMKRYVGIFLWITEELGTDRWVKSQLWKDLWVKSIFSRYLLPGLSPIFDRREPPILKLLVDYYPILHSRMPLQSIDYLYPYIVEALFSKELPLVERVLIISPTLITNLHKFSQSTFLEYCNSLYSLALHTPQESLAIRTLGLINSKILPILSDTHHVTCHLIPSLRFLLCADHFVHLPWLNQQAVKSKDVLSARNRKFSGAKRPLPPPSSTSSNGSSTPTQPQTRPRRKSSIAAKGKSKSLHNPRLGIPPGFPPVNPSPKLITAVVSLCFAISSKFEGPLNSASLILPWLFPFFTTPGFSPAQSKYFQSVVTIMTNRVYSKLGLPLVHIVGLSPSLSESTAPQFVDADFQLGEQNIVAERELESWIGSLTEVSESDQEGSDTAPGSGSGSGSRSGGDAIFGSTPSPTAGNHNIPKTPPRTVSSRIAPHIGANSLQSPHSSRPLPAVSSSSNPAIPPRRSLPLAAASTPNPARTNDNPRSRSPQIPTKISSSIAGYSTNTSALFGSASPEIPTKSTHHRLPSLSDTLEHMGASQGQDDHPNISSFDPISGSSAFGTTPPSNFDPLTSGAFAGLNINMDTPGGSNQPLDLGFLSEMTPANHHGDDMPHLDFSSADIPPLTSGNDGLGTFSDFGSGSGSGGIGEFDPLDYSSSGASSTFDNPYLT